MLLLVSTELDLRGLLGEEALNSFPFEGGAAAAQEASLSKPNRYTERTKPSFFEIRPSCSLVI